jgi:hypothetical protein
LSIYTLAHNRRLPRELSISAPGERHAEDDIRSELREGPRPQPLESLVLDVEQEAFNAPCRLMFATSDLVAEVVMRFVLDRRAEESWDSSTQC